jgi:hypothetical protein
MAEKIIAYKGFDKDFKCRDWQFEVGKSYSHEGNVSACNSGFHACTDPMDIWQYYGPYETRYARVECSGNIDPHKNDSKIACETITILEELSLPEFIKLVIDKKIEETKKTQGELCSSGDSAKIGSSGDSAKIGSSGQYAKIGSSGYSAQIGSSGYSAKIGSSGNSAQIGSSGQYAQIGSSGYSAQIGSSGYSAQIGSSGDSAQIGSSGQYAQIGSSGDSAKIGSSGDSAKIGSSGQYAQIGSSGDSAKIGSSGQYAQIGSSGDSAQIYSTGSEAVIASAGINAKAKGSVGAWISLAEFDDNNKCVGFATGCIGQDGLLPDVWYIASGGKLTKENQ